MTRKTILRRIKIQAEYNGDFITTDGETYYAPRGPVALTAESLRALADILDEKNKEAT